MQQPPVHSDIRRDGSLGEDVGCIFLCGHFVDEDNTVVMVAADESLRNPEMLSSGVVHLLRALQVYASVISALTSGLRRSDSQLMQELAKPKRILDHSRRQSDHKGKCSRHLHQGIHPGGSVLQMPP